MKRIKEWFKKLFTSELTYESPPVITYRNGREVYKCCELHTLTRQRIEDVQYPIADPLHGGGIYFLKQYKYWCSCGTELTEGPRGGISVCAVCEKCKINYGADLPGYWGD